MTRPAKRPWLHAYEHRTHPVLAWPLFLRRAARHAGWGLVAVIAADAIGTLGYYWLGERPWLDAFLNASMILSGMGPVDRMEKDAAKVFAALYALFSGLFFVGVVGLLLAPWLHRMLHVIHADEEK